LPKLADDEWHQGSEISFRFEEDDEEDREYAQFITIHGQAVARERIIGTLEAFLDARTHHGLFARFDAQSSELQEASVLFFNDDGTLRPPLVNAIGDSERNKNGKPRRDFVSQ